MKIKIRIISSYQPTKETERRFDRLASLILENTGKEGIVDQKMIDCIKLFQGIFFS